MASPANDRAHTLSLGAPRAPARSVVEQVTDQVVEMVLSGELPPGQPLPINELAAALGVSHIPVREALRRLESEGLIQYARGRGAQVAPVSPDDLDQIFHLRLAVEADIAQRSVQHWTRESLDDAERRLEAFVAAVGDGGEHPARITPAHTAFHRAMLPGATTWDRRVLEQLYRAIERYIQLYRGFSRPEPEATEDSFDAHRRLLAGARAGGSAYVGAVRDHIAWSRQTLMPWVREAAGAADG